MIGLLTALAVAMTLVLLVSASGIAGRISETDPWSRGPWGIATWTSRPDRSLDVHQKRWETSMLSSRGNQFRWRDLVAEIEQLHESIGTTLPEPAPESFNATWLGTCLDHLESAEASRTNLGDTQQ